MASLACAALLGLLCVPAGDLKVIENSPPRLWIERRVEAPTFTLAYIESDSHPAIEAKNLSTKCLEQSCYAYSYRLQGCSLILNVFMQGGNDTYDGAYYYIIRPNAPGGVRDAVRSVFLRASLVSGDAVAPLNKLESPPKEALNCTTW